MTDVRLASLRNFGRSPAWHGGDEAIVESAGNAIIIQTIDQVVARAQALSRARVAG